MLKKRNRGGIPCQNTKGVTLTFLILMLIMIAKGIRTVKERVAGFIVIGNTLSHILTIVIYLCVGKSQIKHTKPSIKSDRNKLPSARKNWFDI